MPRAARHRGLPAADVIFYDRLVDPAVLELTRSDAERVYVGKAAGADAWPQDRIDRVIVAEALKGRRVVRLKGGDPSIFGRAEEELRAAAEAGIPTQIVPGVTAASAAASSLWWPLSERGATQRLVLATAVSAGPAALRGLAQALTPGTTLAICMGLGAAAEIRDELLRQGLPASLEAEIVSQASSASEVICLTTLGDLVERIAGCGIVAPSIILLRHPARAADAATVPRMSVPVVAA